MSAFDPAAALPKDLFSSLTDLRISDPDLPLRVATGRQRRRVLAPTGRLCLLAADHPARGVTAAGGAPLAMADRHDLLARVLRVLGSGAVDGVLGSMDLIEDLLVLHHLLAADGPGLLDDKLLVASLNRGGLAGSAWELDDPVTGPTPRACSEAGLDGGKLLLRVAPEDAGSLRTLEACAEALRGLSREHLWTFLEPLPVRRSGGTWRVVAEPEPLARLVGVASALGDSSRRLWLKLPVCSDFHQVAAATTLPILLLGGASQDGLGPLLSDLHRCLGASANVRGTLIGRNVLWPGTADPAAVASAISGLVKRSWTVEQALEHATGDHSSAPLVTERT